MMTVRNVVVSQRFGRRRIRSDISQVPPEEAKKPTPFAGPQGPSQKLRNIEGMGLEEHIMNLKTKPIDLAALPLDLVTNAELRLAYSPGAGRLYRVDGAGRVLHELKTWKYYEGRDQFRVQDIWIGGPRKKATHIIWFMMQGRWHSPGMIIDHIDRNPRNNAWSNLRECTPSENGRNADYGARRRWGLDEVLEQGTHRLPNGGYTVVVRGVYIGTFKSRVAANQACREHRRALADAFDVPFETWRRVWR
jgi:hypothetical protein